EVSVKIVSSIVFLFFGTYKLMVNISNEYLTSLNIFIYFAVLGLIEVYLLRQLLYRHKVGERSALKEAATILYIQTQELKSAVDKVCLGEGVCGSCMGDKCLIGYTKEILKEALEEKNYYNKKSNNYINLINKDYDENKLIHALSLIIADYKKYRINLDESFIINKTRKALEIALFEKEIEFTGNVNIYLDNIKKENRRTYRKIDEELRNLV